MTKCTIHDCAATGVYVGDRDSSCSFDECNVVRCGGGGGEIPHGHSGVYVETGKSAISDSFVGGNALTGVSVVRGGKAILNDCDIVNNGAEAITIEDIDRGSSATLKDNFMNNNGAEGTEDITPSRFETIDGRRCGNERGLRGPSVMMAMAMGDGSDRLVANNSNDEDDEIEISPLLPPAALL